MSIFMNLYHGRKSPDESMEDWGTPGPRLRGIETVIYHDSQLYLCFANQYDLREVFLATDWCSISTSSWKKPMQHCLLVSFPDNCVYPELVRCTDHMSLTPIYYSDFFSKMKSRINGLNCICLVKRFTLTKNLNIYWNGSRICLLPTVFTLSGSKIKRLTKLPEPRPAGKPV